MKLSIEEGLTIQKEQLKEWKLRLNDELYSALAYECKRDNEKLTCPLLTDQGYTGLDVFRGTDMLDFIQNYKPVDKSATLNAKWNKIESNLNLILQIHKDVSCEVTTNNTMFAWYSSKQTVNRLASEAKSAFDWIDNYATIKPV